MQSARSEKDQSIQQVDMGADKLYGSNIAAANIASIVAMPQPFNVPLAAMPDDEDLEEDKEEAGADDVKENGGPGSDQKMADDGVEEREGDDAEADQAVTDGAANEKLEDLNDEEDNSKDA